jgi:hypothetical protein
MRILSLDPGSVNFAWTFLRHLELIDHGYLEPVEGEGFDQFGRRFKELLDKTVPEAVIFERFMVRGKHSAIAEPVNNMLGYIMAICDSMGIPWYRITASQWKVHYKKHGGRPSFQLKSHEQDAACIGHYLETYWLNRIKDLEAKAVKKAARKAAKRELHA